MNIKEFAKIVKDIKAKYGDDLELVLNNNGNPIETIIVEHKNNGTQIKLFGQPTRGNAIQCLGKTIESRVYYQEVLEF